MLFEEGQAAFQCNCQKIPISLSQINHEIVSKNGQLLGSIIDINSHFCISSREIISIDALAFPYNVILKSVLIASHSVPPYKQIEESCLSYLKCITDSYDGVWQLSVLKKLCNLLYISGKVEFC